ncbi:MAG: DUF3426 domain-containing protein, partial [Proteobacteria bacterium]|nr:DUF3426 domain-containing protein [Pseudomonadota bacterium]
PECQTVFTISKTQLQGREGLVRCGHCTTVFRGDENLIDQNPAKPSAAESPEAAKPVEAPAPKPKQVATPQAPDPIPASAPAANEPVQEIPIPPAAKLTPVEINTTKKPRHIRPEQLQLSRDEVKDILHGLVGRKPGERTRPLFWGLGILLLFILLAGQTLYYYRDSLAWHPKAGPYVQQACEQLGCSIAPRRDVALIELTGTTVAPHPKYNNILRVKATLINRAKYTQPFPLMEVKLTNRRGETTSRRLFTPDQYLKDKAHLAEGMPLNTARRTRLDVNNPDRKTEGYEIRLVAQ